MDASVSQPMPAAPASAVSYPVRVELDAPNKIARWRPFVHLFMAIPHFIVVYALEILAAAVTFVAFFVILFTKKYPEGMFGIATMAYRYSYRVGTFAFYLREDYPPFEFSTELEDPGVDPARLSIDYPQELNRWLPLVKWLLGFPHLLVLMVLGIGVFGVWFASFFVVLFTGKHSEGMRRYILDVSRYQLRVQAYIGLLRDEYPPFALH